MAVSAICMNKDELAPELSYRLSAVLYRTSTGSERYGTSDGGT